MDGDVWIVSLDRKLVPRCYSVWKQHQRPLKQVLTREFSFVRLNWTSVLRFHLTFGTRSSIYKGSIFFGRSSEHILGMCIDLIYKYSILYLPVTFWIANFNFWGSAWLELRTESSLTLSDYFTVNNLFWRWMKSSTQLWQSAKQSRFRFVPSEMKIWRKRKRWGGINPSLNISEELMKRNDEHCSLLVFKFPAVIVTGRVDAIIRILDFDLLKRS